MKKIVPAKAKPTTKPVDKKFGFQADSDSSSSSSSSDSDSEDDDKKATNKIETIVDDNSDN